MVQANVAAARPMTQRGRSFDDIVFNLFDFGHGDPTGRVEGHRRRASRHLPELGAPVQRPHADNLSAMTLGELRRRDAEADARAGRAEAVRVRNDVMRLQAENQTAPRSEAAVASDRRQRESLLNEQMTHLPRSSGHALPLTRDRDRDVINPNANRPLEASSNRPSPRTSDQSGRFVSRRSQILAARQARGRGTRDQPLVMLSDEESG
jgi:hypothetical protein